MEPGVNRFSFRYLKAKIDSCITGTIHPEWPWWPKEAVHTCSQLLKHDDIVFEFGSGRSTAWLGKRCRSLTSVEHNQEWYISVKKQISDIGLKNINLIFATIDENVLSKDVPYLEPLTALGTNSVDIIIVDGKKRALAALSSLSRLKHGGILIIDDAHRYLPGTFDGKLPNSVDRNIWESVYQEIKVWRKMRTSNGVHATDFYFKP